MLAKREAIELHESICHHATHMVHHGIELRREMLRMQETEGWKELGHDSFPAYSATITSLTRRMVQDLIQQARVERELGLEIGEKIPGDHLKALSQAPEGERAKVYEEAARYSQAHDKPLSANDIRQVLYMAERAQMMAEQAQVQPRSVDGRGQPLRDPDAPESVVFKSVVPMFDGLFRDLGQMRQAVRALGGITGGEMLRVGVCMQFIDHMRRELQYAVPYAQCDCEDGCDICNQRGWLTKRQWEAAQVPQERESIHNASEGIPG